MTRTKSTYLTILAVLLLPMAANAGLIAVVADVNAVEADEIASGFYDAILGSNTSVAFSRNEEQQGALLNYYNTLGGVSAVSDASVLTAAVLSGYDMIVITRFFNNAIDYTAAEMTAIAAFVSNGGTVLAILEAAANSANLTGYNALLSGIGSTISYDGTRTTFFDGDIVAEITSLGPLGVYDCNACNHLSGGTAVYIGQGGPFVAFDDAASVPEPGTLALLGIGLFVMGLARRKKF